MVYSTWFLVELEFGNFGFWGEGKTGVPGEKPLGARERTNNKLNPHMASTPGFEPGPQWWETSALTTAPSLRVHQRAFQYLIYPNTLRYLPQHGVVGVRTGNILKLLGHFYFYISYTCVECGNDVMSYFASSSSLDIVTWNSASGGFACIWQSKWVRIIAIRRSNRLLSL